MRLWRILPGLLLAGVASAAEPGELGVPVKLMIGDKPINVDIGHAAPFYGPIDGDGKNHLMVGQFGEGKLRIYRNEGTPAAPRFEKVAWFLDGAPGGRVPSG